MKKITIYTDGACSGNPGPGGWGAILEYKGVRKEISGGEAETTNNRMELMGIIRALEQLKEPCDITFCSDSKYVMDGLSKGWAKGWRARGWVKSDKKACAEQRSVGAFAGPVRRTRLSLQLGKGPRRAPGK